MAFSGGTFSRLYDWTTDRDNGVKILASRMDQEFDGMATGLSTCILKDGTQTCTAAIPFAEGLTVPDNKTIILGTNSDITIQYDESTNDSLEIAANVEGAALGIVLKADQGDDNADQHKVGIADGGTLTMASKISGSFVSYLTHTPNSTVASSTTAVAGNLTVGGDLTLGSGAVISEAELEKLDGITNGTVAADKAVVVDSNKDIASFRNVTLTGELDAGSLDISGDADIDGTLEADAMTLNGTAITATATLDTGISNNNVPKFTSGVADDDFLRVDGTAIEGRSAAEVLSDIAAAPAAGSSNIVTTGALNSGSITSGFGAIDNGASAITTTGVITGGSLDVDNININGNTIGSTDTNGNINITPNGTGAVAFTTNATFGDNDKAIFGAGSDLQIYHDVSNSYIKDAGTGDLLVQGTQIKLQDASGNDYLRGFTGGAVYLHHAGNTKFETTATGCTITGAVTADGLTVDGAAQINAANAYLALTETDTTNLNTIIRNNGGQFKIQSATDALASTERVLLDHATGDISFYSSDGLSQGLFWDADQQRLGLGVTAPSSIFHTEENTTSASVVRHKNTSNTSGAHSRFILQNGGTSGGDALINLDTQASGSRFTLGVDRSANKFVIANADKGSFDGSDEALVITSAGSVGIGESSPDGLLHLTGDTNSNGAELYLQVNNNNTTDNLGAIHFGNNVDTTLSKILGGTSGANNSSYLTFSTSSAGSQAERIRIQSDGSVQFKPDGVTADMTLDASGNLFIAKTSDTSAGVGITLGAAGFIRVVRNETIGVFNRQGSDGTVFVFGRSDSGVGSIDVTTSGTTYNTTSDIRLKQDIEPLVATDKLMAMNPVSYAWKVDPDGPRSMGFIAQEMKEVMPEAVSTGDDEDAMMSMDYGRITPILVSALQDAHRKIEDLESRLAAMENN